ncbi:MAG: alanine--tRNA ligase [Bdellovibrionales bacterium]|nr:alanine--tRNA ligase [Bdellovibrionales bacterium]
MRAVDLREKFLSFFEENGHQRVPSSSLVPAGDATLLFTNAGMVQFKDNFLGLNQSLKRATSSQKCVRAGGKHNDLENVGFTPRHHTFFEMLGNFSFGDYFKEQAIAYAWQLLTEVLRVPKDRLRITVFEKDDEALALWQAQGVKKEWIYRLGEKDNFWAMGDTGPCGPCTEIHYDWGTAHAAGPQDTSPAFAGTTRFVEIWNLVFMQFDRDASGKMNPLPKPSVDTGAGLERLACIFQNQYNNYDTDLFLPLKTLIARITRRSYGDDAERDASIRVVMDHTRSCTFLIADGVTPTNEGRGYVLRRILRRAIRHGKKLGQEAPFIHQLVPAVVQTLGDAYPEIKANEVLIEEIIHEEELKFHETLDRGMGILEDALGKVKKSGSKTLDAGVAFKLYDTFGFPLDLTQVIAKEHNLEVDEAGFETHMEKQRSQSGHTVGAYGQGVVNSKLIGTAKSQFLGYTSLNSDAKVQLLFSEDGQTDVESIGVGEVGHVVFDRTPFYAESGGQVGDSGTLQSASAHALVLDTRKSGSAFIHTIKVRSGKIERGKSYHLHVDAEKRQFTAINHTATHLLHAALRALPDIGVRIQQAGSLVTPQMLRFDFSCPRALTPDELQKVEDSVNTEIRKEDPVSVEEMGIEQATKKGAIAFFEEKYGDVVRVVRVGHEKTPYSIELCGGTHLKHSGEIGIFKIVSESSVASGTRRIVAYTSAAAQKFLFDRSELVDVLADQLKVAADKISDKVASLFRENKQLRNELDQAKLKLAQSSARGGETQGSLWEKKKDLKGLQIVMERVPAVNPKILRSLVDQIKDKLKTKTVVLLASQENDKVFLCVGVSKDLIPDFDASAIVKHIADAVGGSGGGRPDFAQAGGTRPEGIPQAFEKFEAWLAANG